MRVRSGTLSVVVAVSSTVGLLAFALPWIDIDIATLDPYFGFREFTGLPTIGADFLTTPYLDPTPFVVLLLTMLVMLVTGAMGASSPRAHRWSRIVHRIGAVTGALDGVWLTVDLVQYDLVGVTPKLTYLIHPSLGIGWKLALVAWFVTGVAACWPRVRTPVGDTARIAGHAAGIDWPGP
jgi:hypothetical protein